MCVCRRGRLWTSSPTVGLCGQIVRLGKDDLAVDPAVLRPALSPVTPPHAQQRWNGNGASASANCGPFQVPFLRCREDPLPQPPYGPPDLTPYHTVPVGQVVLRSVDPSICPGTHEERRRRSYRIASIFGVVDMGYGK